MLMSFDAFYAELAEWQRDPLDPVWSFHAWDLIRQGHGAIYRGEGWLLVVLFPSDPSHFHAAYCRGSFEKMMRECGVALLRRFPYVSYFRRGRLRFVPSERFLRHFP